jgi:hypothetical protein
MRHPNMDIPTQILLVSVLALLSTGLVLRTVVFARRYLAEVPHRYPSSWSQAQCGLFAQFQRGVGLSIGILWIAFISAVPQMPSSWPIGYVQVGSATVLLLLTHAWLILVVPRDWTTQTQLMRRFGTMMSFVVAWWVFALCGTGWMIVRASTAAPSFLLTGTAVV